MDSRDIPQADDLPALRRVVEAVVQGARSSKAVAGRSGISSRHAAYRLTAARVLGLVEVQGSEIVPSALGQDLIAAERASGTERELLKRAIAACPIVQALAPDLLSEQEPSREAIASRIAALAGLSAATAARRAGTLLSWRRQLLRAAPAHAPAALPTEESPEAPLCFSRLEVERFGGLRSIAFGLRPFQVLVGPSGSGKSNVLDALAFIADALRMGVSAAVALRGQFEELLWYGQGDRFALALEAELPPRLRPASAQAALRYELQIGRCGDGRPGVVGERLFLCPERAAEEGVFHEVAPSGWQAVLVAGLGTASYSGERERRAGSFPVDPDRLALSALPQGARSSVGLRIRDRLMAGVRRLALGPEVAERCVGREQDPDLLPDGSNLALALERLALEDPASFEEWRGALGDALPEIEEVEVIALDQRVHLCATLQGGLRLPAWRLPSGVRRSLAVSLVPFLDPQGGLWLIEESGLDARVVLGLRQAATATPGVQILVVTRSRAFLEVPPEEILAFSRKGGEISVTRGSGHPLLAGGQRPADQSSLGVQD